MKGMKQRVLPVCGFDDDDLEEEEIEITEEEAQELCRKTMEMNLSVISRMKCRLEEDSIPPEEAIICLFILQTDDEAKELAESLDVEEENFIAGLRENESISVPFVQDRVPFQSGLEKNDPVAAKELSQIKGWAIVVVGYGIAAVYPI